MMNSTSDQWSHGYYLRSNDRNNSTWHGTGIRWDPAGGGVVVTTHKWPELGKYHHCVCIDAQWIVISWPGQVERKQFTRASFLFHRRRWHQLISLAMIYPPTICFFQWLMVEKGWELLCDLLPQANTREFTLCQAPGDHLFWITSATVHETPWFNSVISHILYIKKLKHRAVRELIPNFALVENQPPDIQSPIFNCFSPLQPYKRIFAHAKGRRISSKFRGRGHGEQNCST